MTRKAPKIPGKSTLRNNKGTLSVPNGYLRMPYCLLKSEDFLALSPLAVKVYWIMLSRWKTHRPDEPVEISIDEIRKLCPSDGKKGGHIRRNKIVAATNRLIVDGFIEKVSQHKQRNKYFIEQRRFTGEWR